MIDLSAQKQFFSEEIRICSNIRTSVLVKALSAVPREKFLPAGPWSIRGEGNTGSNRLTPNADPRFVYHNISVAIDQKRQLYNGAPGTVAPWIDSLDLKAGSRVLHVGCGLGYYTAIMAYMVGSSGHIRALEVDEDLAMQAGQNLSSFEWVDVRHGNGMGPMDREFDAALIHAGVTHPLDTWLDALTVQGRIVFPLTATMPQMGTIGKGWTFILTKRKDGSFEALPGHIVSIYSAVDIRNEDLNSSIGAALMHGPFPMVQSLRRDPHPRSTSCWLHGPGFCLGTD